MDKMIRKFVFLIVILCIIILLSKPNFFSEKEYFQLSSKEILKYERELSYNKQCNWYNLEKATKLFVYYKAFEGNSSRILYWNKYIKQCNKERLYGGIKKISQE